MKMAHTEESIQSALADLDSGIYSSLRQAAKGYGIPQTTVQTRQADARPHAIAHSCQQRLTSDQEEFLADWILDEDSRASPPRHARVRKMAARILAMNHGYIALGRNWVPGFICRDPQPYLYC